MRILTSNSIFEVVLDGEFDIRALLGFRPRLDEILREQLKSHRLAGGFSPG
jgi:hypothetical protein